ncbi:MAG: hypothetical protein HY700_12600 [Gemmatimonadetes bacterium]|nr:hypothetical protein [Gemmatimonadota bacterium]
MLDKRKARYLTGETIREIGILTLVFVPLDILLASQPINLLGISLGLAGGLISIAVGIVAESRV